MSLSIKLTTLGKYLDQPALIKKVNNVTPVLLAAGGAGYCAYDTLKQEESKRKNKLIQNASVLTFTIASALFATRGLSIKGKKVFNGLIELPHIHPHDIEDVASKAYGERILSYIDKVKNGKVLRFKQLRDLEVHLNETLNDPTLIKKIIPDGHNHGSFLELKNLSLLGFIPVVGGVLGGVVGDVLTKNNPKSNLPDKIKEGAYQYLNNIFLCNVGAGLSMVLMNKLNIKSNVTRFAGMCTGVIGLGLVSGNLIANLVGKNIINPIFEKKKVIHNHFSPNSKDLNCESCPEVLDANLHIDDVASVGFISGLKWLAPILPVVYSVSGYRAGIGQHNRNNVALADKD